MGTYLAKVNILISAENDAEACDVMSESLSGNLQHNGVIIDWCYERKGQDFLRPVRVDKLDMLSYEEGDMVSIIDTPYSK